MSDFAIDEHERAAVERRRLMRVLDKRTRAPTEREVQQYNAMVEPLARGSLDDARNRFVGMHAVTLTEQAARETLDLDGFGSLKADGVHAHLACLGGSHKPRQRRRSGAESEITKPRALPPMQVAVLATRDGTLRAVDGIQMHNRDEPVLLDGELCLRKKKLTREEDWRIKSARNVHRDACIDYPLHADSGKSTAVDLASDAHQAQYDDEWRLVYAAFDCLLVIEAQVARPYAERVQLVHELLETPPLLQKSARHTRRAQKIALSSEAAREKGIEQLPLLVFGKPVWRVADVDIAFHAAPHCMHGVPLDGVVFTPNDAPYVPGTNHRVLKWKPVHTLDLAVDERGRPYVLNGGKRVAVTDTIVAESDRECNLFAAAQHQRAILECAGERHAESASVRWRPVLLRREKKRPNNEANYRSVRRAVLEELDEDKLRSILRARLASGTGLQ